MPFLMTHLHVAKNLYTSRRVAVQDLSQFYLGVAAPDAVHNRPNYISDYKKASHLVVGDEPWGSITNNNEWRDNVLSFLHEHGDDVEADFLTGYCVHILTDIYNNVNVWTPFKQKHQDEWALYDRVYGDESTATDIVLALNPQNHDDFWISLQASKPLDFYGLISGEELEIQKQYILHSWYAGVTAPDTASHIVVSAESTLKLISNATEFVAEALGV